ncbi:capsular biosynthesis protein [Alcanivorax sp. N3-2A]|nr:capsular biosynthesis protein [Alcanivorax sp. N3-2A]
MSQRRLLIVTTTAETLATILREQPRYLAEHFQVAVSCARDGHYAVLESDLAVPVFPVAMARGISPWRDLRSIFAMLRVMRAFKPDIVHSYTPKAGLVAMSAAWLLRVPARVHTFTGLIFPSASGFKRRLLIAVDRLIARLATRAVPESEGVKRDLLAHRITRRPQPVIGHGNIAGVDTVLFDADRPEVAGPAATLRRTTLAGAAFTFCYVGRINRDKGLTELADAFQTLPDNAALLLVGELDTTAPPAGDALAWLKADPRVHFAGFQRDVRPFIAASDALVLPSYREGFPNVVLQALSLSRPVIVTDVSGANEITVAGENGWIVPVGDADALHRAMQHALDSDAGEIQEMGRSGRSRVAARHERALYLQHLRDFYDSL